MDKDIKQLRKDIDQIMDDMVKMANIQLEQHKALNEIVKNQKMLVDQISQISESLSSSGEPNYIG